MIHQDFIVIILTVKLVIIIQLIRIMVLRCDYHFLNFIIIAKQIIFYLMKQNFDSQKLYHHSLVITIVRTHGNREWLNLLHYFALLSHKTIN